MWFVCYAETIEGKLAAFTVANFITNISCAKVPCWAAAINLSAVSVVMQRCFQTQCWSPPHRHKGLRALMLGNLAVALLQLPESAGQNFGRVRNSPNCPMVSRKQVFCPIMAGIQLDSKMSRAAQISSQKQAKTTLCVSSFS